MGNWIVLKYKKLEKYVNDMFNGNAANRSDPKHPENQCINQAASQSVPVITAAELLTTKIADEATAIEEQMPTTATNNVPVTIEPSTTMKAAVVSSNECSDFYVACRLNKIEEVQEFLKKIERGEIERKEIDRMEPNSSTALHAAAFHGHLEIVRLLLEAGADRAIPNKYKCVPFQEAKNKETKQLFVRIPNSGRLKTDAGTIEWDLIGDDVLANAIQLRHDIKSIYDNATGTTPIDDLFEKIEKNYIGKALVYFDGIEKIKRFFRDATEKTDPLLIIKAYTAETDFYKIFNRELAGGSTKCDAERKYIIALISHHPNLDKLSYTGTSYRVIQMTDDDLQNYRVGCSLMTKSFLSSSFDKKIAGWFLYQQEWKKIVSDPDQQAEVVSKEESDQLVRYNAEGKKIKQWIMCVYNIKHRRTALRIERSSQYIMEGEVLIMPYSVFKVTKIEQVQHSELSNEPYTEIELEEYDQYVIVRKNK